jgi:hypothetical protein
LDSKPTSTGQQPSICKQCGKSLTPGQRRLLHDEIAKQGLTREEILELMKALFGCSAGVQ